MSRQEDFDRQADDYSNCCFEEDDSLFAAFHFKEGAEYGYKYAIDKMEEYLLSALKHELGYFATGDFVKGVMKFMEGL